MVRYAAQSATGRPIPQVFDYQDLVRHAIGKFLETSGLTGSGFGIDHGPGHQRGDPAANSAQERARRRSGAT